MVPEIETNDVAKLGLEVEVVLVRRSEVKTPPGVGLVVLLRERSPRLVRTATDRDAEEIEWRGTEAESEC